MDIRFFGTYEKMSLSAADFVEAELKSKKNYILGLPTGSTPLGMYAALIKKHKAGELDFSDVTTFNLDEYYPIKRTNEQSYYKFMYDNFFSGINIKSENVNLPNGEADDADIECAEYEKKLNAAGGLDLMVLGLGPNGHIGFNEPDNYLISETHSTGLTPETREANKRFFNSIEEVPDRALTMGMASIMKAKKILILVTGESKKNAFKELLTGKITTKNPVTFLNLHRDVTVMTDLKIEMV